MRLIVLNSFGMGLKRDNVCKLLNIVRTQKMPHTHTAPDYSNIHKKEKQSNLLPIEVQGILCKYDFGTAAVVPRSLLEIQDLSP